MGTFKRLMNESNDNRGRRRRSNRGRRVDERVGGVVGIGAVNTNYRNDRRKLRKFDPSTIGGQVNESVSYVKLYEDDDGTLGLKTTDHGEIQMVVRDGKEETFFEISDQAVDELRSMIG